MKNDEHLDIDLSFLDESGTTEPSPRSAQRTPAPTSAPTASSQNKKARSIQPTEPAQRGQRDTRLRNVFLFVIAATVVVSVMLANHDSSKPSVSRTPPPQNTNSTQNINPQEDEVVVGTYRCSSYHASKAKALTPSESELLLEAAQGKLEQQELRLESLGEMLEGSPVNEYSDQWEIDLFNRKVDEYNDLLADYNRDFARVDARIDTFNGQVDRYNAYLEANCTKSR